MLIEIIGNRIKMKFPSPPELDTQYKLLSIPGASENKDGTVWSWPINMTVCEAARGKFGDELTIGPKLLEWATEYRRREDVVRSAQGAKQGDDRDALAMLPNVARYARPLFDLVSNRWYQVEGGHALANAQKMILADQPGLGKTFQSIAGALEHFYSQGNFSPMLLVLAPTTVVTTNWEPTILSVVPGAFVYTMDGSRAQREGAMDGMLEEYDPDDDKGPRFVLGNPEMARVSVWWRCVYQPKDSCDECDSLWKDCQNPKRHTRVKHEVCGKEWKKHNEMGIDEETGNPYPKACLDPEHKKGKKHRLMEEASYQDMLHIAWDGVILDESQKVLVTNTSVKAKMSMQRRGMMRLQADVMQALTGTPYRGKPQRLWGTLNWLDPKGHPSYRKWLDHHFVVTEYEHHEGFDIGGLNEETEEAFLKSQGAIMLRRTKTEPGIADQLPPKQYTGWWLDEQHREPGGHGIWLPMEGRQAQAYKQMRDSAVAALDGGTLNAIGVLAEMTRLRQFASSCAKMIADGKDGQYVQPVLPSNKLTWLMEFLDTLDGKVVVVSQFTGLLNMFDLVLRSQSERTDGHKRDWGKITKITGQVTGRARTAAQQAFQTDPETRVMLLNLQAGGVGIDLDAQCDDMVFLDEHYIPDDNEQAEDRIHRVSRNHTCTYHYLRSLGTIEEHIARTSGGRDVIQKRLLDGSRGVEFARTLV